MNNLEYRLRIYTVRDRSKKDFMFTFKARPPIVEIVQADETNAIEAEVSEVE